MDFTDLLTYLKDSGYSTLVEWVEKHIAKGNIDSGGVLWATYQIPAQQVWNDHIISLLEEMGKFIFAKALDKSAASYWTIFHSKMLLDHDQVL